MSHYAHPMYASRHPPMYGGGGGGGGAAAAAVERPAVAAARPAPVQHPCDIISMEKLIPSEDDRSHAHEVLATLVSRCPAEVRARLRCEVLAVASETLTLRVRGLRKTGSKQLGRLLDACPGTMRSYEADGGADDRSAHGLVLHLELQRGGGSVEMSQRGDGGGGGGGGRATSGVPRKRAAPSSGDDSSSSDDEPLRGKHVRKSRAAGGPVYASVSPLTIKIERPVVLPAETLRAVERNDQRMLARLTDMVCNADVSMPRVELTVLPRGKDYVLVYAGVRLLSWPLVRRLRASFVSVAFVELWVMPPLDLAMKLLGLDTTADEAAELAAVWADAAGVDNQLSALLITVQRSSKFNPAAAEADRGGADAVAADGAGPA